MAQVENEVISVRQMDTTAQVRSGLKRMLVKGLVTCGVDRLFRTMNRNRLLVVMYHGVTRQCHLPPIWTQLPLPVFKAQLEFLKSRYQPVSLTQVLQTLDQEAPLPERAVLITFDDGLSNNYSVAFPVLRELSVPAAIFLTVDVIGTRDLLWFDELYLLIREGGRRGAPLELPIPEAQRHYRAGRLWDAYVASVEGAKRAGEDMRRKLMDKLRAAVLLDREKHLEDFGLLTWDQVREMERSGLVRFGVHTARHRILSELTESELEGEVLTPRRRFAAELGREPESFCFPNGIPGIDFHPGHQAFLRSCGYRCAFSTERGLFDPGSGERMGIARIAVGNDGSSDPDYFNLNTAGAWSLFHGW